MNVSLLHVPNVPKQQRLDVTGEKEAATVRKSERDLGTAVDLLLCPLQLFLQYVCEIIQNRSHGARRAHRRKNERRKKGGTEKERAERSAKERDGESRGRSR